MDEAPFDVPSPPLPLGRLNFPPTPRPRSRHNAGRQQQRRPYLCTQRRLLDWNHEEQDQDHLGSLNPSDDLPAEQQDNWANRVGKLLFGDDQGLADITFVLIEEVCGEGNRVRDVKLKAHKFILSLRSPVFHAMFYGPLAESNEDIAVPDVSLPAFKAMLTYIYKDIVNLQTLQSAWQLWYAAKKYMIESLEEKCRKYLKTHLTPLNVLDTYAFAEQYGDPQVLYQCLRLIDFHAKFILSSPSFVYLPIHYSKAIVCRKTLNITEIEVFQCVIRWIQAEIERKLQDIDPGEVKSLKEIFLSEFCDLIHFEGMSSQDFVHHVLPQGVLGNDAISDIAAKIRLKEEETAQKPAKDNNVNSKEQEKSKLGLNQARDLLFFEQAISGHPCSNSFLRTGVVHAAESDVDPNKRCGPGYYQLSRFSPLHELALIWKWPREYSLKFKTNKSIYLLGACITETDRKFYSPKVKYFLKLKDGNGKIISEGSETFIKKTSSKYEGGFPKALDYGPHDVSFRNVAYLFKDKWYELNIKISEEMWSVCPLLVCKCKRQVENFGVEFEFEPSYDFNKKSNNLETFRKESVEENSGEEASESESDFCEEDLAYGLISRLYFFY